MANSKTKKDTSEDSKKEETSGKGTAAIITAIAALLTALVGGALALQKMGYIGEATVKQETTQDPVVQRSNGPNSPNVNNTDGDVIIRTTPAGD